MKKLIALSAAAVMASSAAMADVAISGTASVSYDDGGADVASDTTYDAGLVIVGTSGATTVTVKWDLEADLITGIDLATSIGPVTIAADMWNEDTAEVAGSATDSDGDGFAGDGTGDAIAVILDSDDTSVTVSLDVPVGDMTIGLDDSGDITLTGTFSGVTISHTIQDGADSTTGSASIAGMDISLTNDGGDSTWSIGTTVSGIALTLNSDTDITAAFGLAGNTLTVSHVGKVALVAAVDAVAATATAAAVLAEHDTLAADAYTTVAISRDLTSGATLTATYSSADDSLTLKAAVAF